MNHILPPQWLLTEQSKIAPLSSEHLIAAQKHYDGLAKPPGSLGRLEAMGSRLAAIQNGQFPLRSRPARMLTIAADHGVCDEGIAFTPQEVTEIMVLNFVKGGAAINSLCRTAGAELVIVDVGTKVDFPAGTPIIHHKLAYGSKNFTQEPAMTSEECLAALHLGIDLAEQALKDGIAVVGLGEMGIGNTTPSSALFCAYLGFSAEEMTGMGAGMPPKGLAHKTAVIAKGLALHHAVVAAKDPIGILASLGGLEIATLTGLIIGCAARRIAIMVDGFIATAAFTAARAIAPLVHDYCFFSHGSAEIGHGIVLKRLGEKPYLDLGLRLGEGTGAALGFMLLNAAADAYNDMSTLVDNNITLPS